MNVNLRDYLALSVVFENEKSSMTRSVSDFGDNFRIYVPLFYTLIIMIIIIYLMIIT